MFHPVVVRDASSGAEYSPRADSGFGQRSTFDIAIGLKLNLLNDDDLTIMMKTGGCWRSAMFAIESTKPLHGPKMNRNSIT